MWCASSGLHRDARQMQLHKHRQAWYTSGVVGSALRLRRSLQQASKQAGGAGGRAGGQGVRQAGGTASRSVNAGCWLAKVLSAADSGAPAVLIRGRDWPQTQAAAQKLTGECVWRGRIASAGMGREAGEMHLRKSRRSMVGILWVFLQPEC